MMKTKYKLNRDFWKVGPGGLELSSIAWGGNAPAWIYMTPLINKKIILVRSVIGIVNGDNVYVDPVTGQTEQGNSYYNRDASTIYSYGNNIPRRVLEQINMAFMGSYNYPGTYTPFLERLDILDLDELFKDCTRIHFLGHPAIFNFSILYLTKI